VVEVLAFHAKIRMKMDESMAEMLCREIYDCPPISYNVKEL
jgi:hypothetical protein